MVSVGISRIPLVNFPMAHADLYAPGHNNAFVLKQFSYLRPLLSNISCSLMQVLVSTQVVY